MATAASDITATPIAKRPKPGVARGLIFNAFFLVCILSLHGAQLITLPLWLVPATRPYFWQIELHLEGMFGLVLVVISQVFAPTKIRLTTEGGALALDKIAKRDANGVVRLNLPRRAVFMANHQVYLDWLYTWTLLYFAGLHRGVVIILKASLKWVPIVGPAMQLFQFIFLARKWESDRVTLASQLLRMGRRAQKDSNPLTLLIYPEGTLVSPLTRPISQKYAEKNQMEDMKHSLIPRSTGLLFVLRGLAKGTPDLKLIDTIVAYPGIPVDGYGQDHFTLQEVFGNGRPPTVIHMHMRSYDVLPDLPIGKLPEASDPNATADVSEAERDAFGAWLLERWREKDARLGDFYRTGALVPTETEAIEIELRARVEDVVKLAATMIASMMAWRYVLRVLWYLVRG